VTWENANRYCQWAGRTLADEAQWEKAARGWDGRKYPWGNDEPNCFLANYTGCYPDTMPVGSLPAGASPYGAMDMAGNVWEWVADWYPSEAYPTPFPLESQDAKLDALHVIRGGSWANDTLVLESAVRFIGWPIDEISVGFGFRCALDIDSVSAIDPLNSPESTSTPEIEPTQRVFGPGNHYATIKSGGFDRFFIIHIPPTYQSGETMPVVLNFHGRTSNAFDEQRYTQFDSTADQYGFIVVYPQAMGAPTTWQDLPIESEIDDVQFIRELISYLDKNLNIDTKRIYATGVSNGGGMVNRLACDMADLIAAVAPVAGAYYYWDICEPSQPIPLVSFHGIKDNIIPFGGTQSDEFIELPDILEWATAWGERNGCSPEVTHTSDAGVVIRDAWTNCNDGADVVLYSLTLEGHNWPTGVFEETKSANDIIWEFFSAYPMP
jgi:polyhydroxybutyrate depolymerase